MSIGVDVMEEVMKRLVYMGYDTSVVDYLEVVDVENSVRVVRYPRVDDYSGVPASLLRILIRDIDRVVEELNLERGKRDE